MGMTNISYPTVLIKSATEPANKSVGTLWYDTSGLTLNVANGSAYSGIGGATDKLAGILGVYDSQLTGYTGEPSAVTNIANMTDSDPTTSSGGWTYTEGAGMQPRTEVKWDLGSNGTSTLIIAKLNGQTGAGGNCWIEVSEDDSTWTSVWSAGVNSAFNYDEGIVLDVDEQKFRYIRIRFGNWAGYGGVACSCTVTELRVY